MHNHMREQKKMDLGAFAVRAAADAAAADEVRAVAVAASFVYVRAGVRVRACGRTIIPHRVARAHADRIWCGLI